MGKDPALGMVLGICSTMLSSGGYILQKLAHRAAAADDGRVGYASRWQFWAGMGLLVAGSACAVFTFALAGQAEMG
jgi:hypothetical protein